jgi:hypothetical protein
MRKIILFLLLMISVTAFSQDKFKFKSIEYGIGTYKISNRNSVFVLNGALDVTTAYKSNLFTLSNVIGFGFGKNEDSNTDLEGYYEVDLLYGREFKLSDKFYLETHTGIGFISQNNTTNSDEKQSWAMPVKLKFLYYTGKKFAVGLNPNVSFNKVNAIYSLNFLLHLNF